MRRARIGVVSLVAVLFCVSGCSFLCFVDRIPVVLFDYVEEAPGLFSFCFTGYGMRDGAALLVSWDFGDGATATGYTASHRYVESGEYIVTAAAVDDAGTAACLRKTVIVETGPCTSAGRAIVGASAVRFKRRNGGA